MKGYYLQKYICCLLLSLVFISSCKGQNETKQDRSSGDPIGQPKIKKPIGRHQDDNVRCGLQDKAGNLWFGTSGEGVYRYDGKLFANFTEKDGLFNNSVWCILEDRDGYIWVGSSCNGLNRYDGKTFTSFTE